MVGDPHSDFWRHRKVLVTGGNGFLGSAVLRELHDVGAAEYDLRRRDDAEAMIGLHSPDLVIHLAAKVGGIGANMERPSDLYLDNLLMGTHLLDATLRSGRAHV